MNEIFCEIIITQWILLGQQFWSILVLIQTLEVYNHHGRHKIQVLHALLEIRWQRRQVSLVYIQLYGKRGATYAEGAAPRALLSG